MTDTTLEATYLSVATTYIDSIECVDPAIFINGVTYGLDLREAEIQALKDRITELGG